MRVNLRQRDRCGVVVAIRQSYGTSSAVAMGDGPHTHPSHSFSLLDKLSIFILST